jgi:OmpA-OmpF porin, OOP family
MKTQLVMTVILGGAMLTGGCATKKYVRNTTAPIQAKVDQVGDQTNKNATDLADARKEIKAVDERAETGISAAKERAMTADNHAGEAMTKATEAATIATDARSMSQKNTTEIEDVRQSIRNVVANIDDYKPVAEATVQFAFGKDKLTPEAKESLDKLAASKSDLKRCVIAVEGFTDKTGTADYNNALSQRRANAVVNYLVAEHDIPVFRVFTVGLGAQKPAMEGNSREARAKDRRVEVKIFSADQTMATTAGPAKISAPIGAEVSTR